MFSGIIEATTSLIRVSAESEILRIQIERPIFFDDLRVGDSIAINGVCLTVEEFNSEMIQFALGAETQRLLEIKFVSTTALSGPFSSTKLNCERSLKFGDRIHGHMVSGHAEGNARISLRKPLGENLILEVDIPESFSSGVRKKGSITLNGVSLTVNDLKKSTSKITVSVCLIPETLKKTNLGLLQENSILTFETDPLLKMISLNQWADSGAHSDSNSNSQASSESLPESNRNFGASFKTSARTESILLINLDTVTGSKNDKE